MTKKEVCTDSRSMNQMMTMMVYFAFLS